MRWLETRGGLGTGVPFGAVPHGVPVELSGLDGGTPGYDA